jgi:nicotinamidase-related amidase
LLDFGIAPQPKKMDVQNGYTSPQKNLQPSQLALLIKQEAAENAAAAAAAAAAGNVLILPPMHSHLMQGLISSSKMLLHPMDNNMQHPQEFLADPSYPFPPSAVAVMQHYHPGEVRICENENE